MFFWMILIELNIIVYNMKGEIIVNENITKYDDSYEINAEWPTGIYILQVNSAESGRQSVKIVVD